MANTGAYAGDIPPKQAWEMLEQDSEAVLIDVRTQPEWRFVGVPVLETLGKRPMLLEWIRFPDGARNEGFVDQLKQAVGEQDRPLLFLCRSGARSAAAAAAMTQAGYTQCYNIAEGFEGDKDPEGHRGRAGGWKVAGLPWAQE